MSGPVDDPRAAGSALIGETRETLSIGGLERETGVPANTLRSWETRYGVPRPTRLESGHRRYTWEDVERVRLVVRGVEGGGRVSELLGLDLAELHRRCDVDTGEHPELGPLLAAIRSFDRGGLRDGLQRLAATRRVVDVLEEVVCPLLIEVGLGWERGELTIGQEHFGTSVVAEVLSVWRRDTESPFGPRRGTIVAATPPGELHEQALSMISLVAQDAGVEACVLGASCPVRDIVAAVRGVGAFAVLMHVSEAGRGRSSDDMLAELRARLPMDVDLVVGGSGARGRGRHAVSVPYLKDLRALRAWFDERQ